MELPQGRSGLVAGDAVPSLNYGNEVVLEPPPSGPGVADTGTQLVSTVRASDAFEYMRRALDPGQQLDELGDPEIQIDQVRWAVSGDWPRDSHGRWLGDLLAVAHEVDHPPVITAHDHRTRVEELPDELFLREFLEVDATNATAIADFAMRWGPLWLPDLGGSGVHHGADAVVVPIAWARAAHDHAEQWRLGRGRWRPDGPQEDALRRALDEAENQHERQLLIAEYSRRQHEQMLRPARTRATVGAAADPLAVALDRTGRGQSSHQNALLGVLFEDYLFPYGEESLYAAGNDDRLLPITAASIWSQQAILATYQATFACWVELVANPESIADEAALRAAPRDAFMSPWVDAGLPTPATMYDLLGTMQLLVNAGAQGGGQVLELEHPDLEAEGLAVGRRVPTILPALCQQLVSWVGEGLPARRCANETCQRHFVRQRGRAEQGQYRTTGVKYCSASCGNAEANRRYRRRKAQADGDRKGRTETDQA